MIDHDKIREAYLNWGTVNDTDENAICIVNELNRVLKDRGMTLDEYSRVFACLSGLAYDCFAAGYRTALSEGGAE